MGGGYCHRLRGSRAASPRRNEGVTGNENPGCLSSSSSSSSSEIEYEDDDDDEDDPSRQLEVIGKPAARLGIKIHRYLVSIYSFFFPDTSMASSTMMKSL